MNFFRCVRGHSISSTANDKWWIIHIAGFPPPAHKFLFSSPVTPTVAISLFLQMFCTMTVRFQTSCVKFILFQHYTYVCIVFSSFTSSMYLVVLPSTSMDGSLEIIIHSSVELMHQSNCPRKHVASPLCVVCAEEHDFTLATQAN